MASVKFNRGNWAASLTGQDNAISFLRSTGQNSDPTGTTAAGENDYGFIYLGGYLAATKYLKALDLKGFSAGAGLLEIGTSSDNPILVTRTIVSTYTAGTTTWTSSTADVPTAGAIVNYVAEQIGANDTYHGTGVWDGTTWNKYIAKYYKGDTEVTSGATGYHALEFTLPVHSWSTTSAFASDETHLATPKQVADYIATMSGAMEYKGQLTAAMAAGGTGTHPAYKPGDTFIASEAISSIHAEAGDMVIVSSAIAQDAAFASSGSGANCNVFERNLDGALTKSTTAFTQYGVAYVENTTGTIASTAVGTSGQYLKSTGAGAPTWEDYVFYTIAAGSTANILDITKYKNGSVDTSYGTNGTLSITINDVAHATNADKILQKVSTTDADVPLLIGQNNDSTANPAVTDDTPKDINYSALIKANASTGMITSKDLTVNTKTGSTYGNDTIDVAAALTWQTLS